MDAVTPKGAQTADTHSHLVRPDSMEWQKTRFPGCEAKTLLFDRKTGLMTALMRFAPGAVLPDHEHVNIEQTYVLEGSLVDKEGPAKGFPANLNVAVALSLAGIGPDRTRVEIWADPTVTRNTHRIEVDSDSARFSMGIENIPSENPKTGKITALSVIACLRKLRAPLRIGT